MVSSIIFGLAGDLRSYCLNVLSNEIMFCTICCERRVNGVCLPCGHTGCMPCFEEWEQIRDIVER